MASVEQCRGKWRVRWRDQIGSAYSRTCPSAAVAHELKREVEAVACPRAVRCYMTTT